MTSSSTIQLVNQYNIFMGGLSSQNEDDIQRQRKFHKHLSKRQDYKQLLKCSLRVGCEGQRKDLFVCGEYLGYIINFQPQFEQQFYQQVKRYIEVVVNKYFHYQQAKNLFVRLSQGEEIYFLHQIKQKIEDMTIVTCIQEVQIYINILIKKINWELRKDQIIRKRYNHQFHKFIDQLITFLCDKSYDKKEEILWYIIQMVILTFKYLKKEIIAYKSLINDLMEGWLVKNIYKNQIKVELFKVLTMWIQSFGFEKVNLLYQFFNKNIGSIENIHYLKMFSAFLDKVESNQINQKQITKILKTLINNCVNANSTSSELYEVKSHMIDLIIKMSTLFTCDLSKHLQQYYKQASNDSHKSLMTSLMYVFDRSFSVQTIKTIQHHKLKYLQTSKPNQYLCHSVLNQYCQQFLQFEEFIINPQMMDNFLWEFLMIRTTVSVNYSVICEINKVCNLVVNLIKFILLDIYSPQCCQIIQKIVNNNPVYALNSLKTLSFSKIISQAKPILMKTIINEQSGDDMKFPSMFQNLSKVVVLITKSYEIQEMSSMKLVGSILKLSNELPMRFITSGFIKYQSELLYAVTPVQFNKISQTELHACIQELVQFIHRYESVTSFEFYLQIMRRATYEQHLHNVLMNSSQLIEPFLQSHRLDMAQNLEDIYKINYFILTNSQFNEEILTNCWNILFNNETFHYTQLCFYIIDLFRYFSSWFRSYNQEEVKYICLQFQNALIVLDHIDNSIQKIICLKKIEELLCCKLSLMIYLQELVERYWQIAQFACEQVKLVHKYILSAYDNMKDIKFYLSCFDQGIFSIKEYWCNIQALVLLMIPSIVSKQKSQTIQFLVGKLLQVDERFEWLKNIFPKTHKKQLEQFTLCFNCEINELRLMADKKISSSQI